MTDLYRFTPGTTPVLISIPHAGTDIPAEMAARMSEVALAIPDTDWHVDRLYDFAPALGVGMIVATQSRYVVDLNRDPAGKPLYRGADNTELVPLTTFDRVPIYRSGLAPDDAETAMRIARYWRPYHDRIAQELDALKERFGVAVLWDAHSIPSMVPRFFEGRLADFNLGSVRGASASPDLIGRVMAALDHGSGFSAALDGRFAGGYITRRFGRPADGVHALQLELAQSTYMDEAPPYRFDPVRAASLKLSLQRAIVALVAWARETAQVGA
jgi:N-formylglutamate amidohydrolase